MKTWSWSDLGRSWAILGRSWVVLWRSLGDLGWCWGGLGVVLGDLGVILGGLGAVFGESWGVLGRSWAALGASWGDPKSIQKSIRNLTRKQAESRRKKMAQTLRLSMFQSLTGGAATQIRPPLKCIDIAIEGISSYIYIITNHFTSGIDTFQGRPDLSRGVPD